MPRGTAALINQVVAEEHEPLTFPPVEEILAECIKAAGLEMADDGQITMGGPTAEEMFAEVQATADALASQDRLDAVWGEAKVENDRRNEEAQVTNLVRKQLAEKARLAAEKDVTKTPDPDKPEG